MMKEEELLRTIRIHDREMSFAMDLGYPCPSLTIRHGSRSHLNRSVSMQYIQTSISVIIVERIFEIFTWVFRFTRYAGVMRRRHNQMI